MSILLLLIPISLIFVGIAVWAFLWAVNHDQFDDLDRAARSILFDDDLASAPPDSPTSAEFAAPEAEPRAGEARGPGPATADSKRGPQANRARS